MTNSRNLLCKLLISLIAILTIAACGLMPAFSQPEQAISSSGERYALIIAGAGGEDVFTEKYFAQTDRLYDLLTKRLGYDKKHLIYLFAEPSFDSLKITGISNAQNIRSSFRQLYLEMTAKDQLFIFLAGHGSFDGVWGKFNLVGPDLPDIEYAQLLAKLPTKKIIFVNTASASGPFIKKLSAENRIIITATKSGSQFYETNFADFFIEALATDEADFDKDHRLSLRETFQYARTSQDRWFEEQRRLRAEHPLLDDNGDGEGSQHFTDSGDGLLAGRVYLGPVSDELQQAQRRFQAGKATGLDKLTLEKFNLEQEIAELKANKQKLAPEDYAGQFEKLLIKLARTNRKLKELGDNQSDRL